MATAVAVLLTAGLLVAGPGRTEAAATKRAPDPARVVTPGIVFNHPFRSTKKKTRIQRKIISTVKNVPAGETIRLMTWNFDSPKLTKVFVNAHKRGVSVQIIMARGLAKSQGPGRSYPTLRKALAKGNADRPKPLRSWIRTCASTCRGKGGAMHSKLMLVSRSGATSWIAMQGSGNFTGAAAVQQFNDWTTITENQPLYDGWMTMWKQAKKDKNTKPLRFTVPSTTTPGSTITSIFAPHKKKVDPALKVLNQVQCTGASNVPGGRTKVRIANAVWGDQRGVKVARKVRALANAGCDVRIVFMMMPLKIRNILRGLPAKQMVYITGATANKFKDRYVHLKGLSVQGNVGGRADGNVVLSSSENWTQLGWHSDEQNVIFWDDAALAAKYADQVDLIYRQAPRSINNYVNSADPNGRIVPGTEFLAPKDYPFHELELG
ncbi:phospholipase D-like domain-containing protein [Nocardioides nitrophenolicus]|uniref:phospholipase D-like domain-containing protein n=1 Tax=Nocardioides nitrophenolicus TaxID=60489 RepID=UPI00195ADE09|nr:phospholipase D-like domain-containing protein [Nocardioides nitrophenolicus]MBM7520275.1 phosphatidylserine/phosphatidylglycerophosphate/cardiolipin synthase-like enzyme [Nocardioides nitrophenolicus]